MMIMMTAVHLWLLALSPKAVLQYFLKRLPAGGGMPYRSKGSAVSALINVICIFRIKLILIRGRFST